jgi:uncharacterized protein YbjT (DUF2867 family)
MKSAPILVVGSTGAVGSELVKQLLQKGQRVRGATRNPDAAAKRFNSTAEFVPFDLLRPETYAAALAGVKRAFLMARPGDEHSDRLAIPLIDEMKRHGVQYVVDLSAMGAERRNDFALRKVERHLEMSGMAFTHLRPNWFMQIFTAGSLLNGIRSTATIALPTADAKISYIDVRDIAAIAAETLTVDGHANKAYTLTGSESLDHWDVAREMSEAVGKPIQYVPISEDDARKALRFAGFPPPWVERLVGFYRLVRSGECATVSPDATAVLKHSPRTFRQFVADHMQCWLESVQEGDKHGASKDASV